MPAGVVTGEGRPRRAGSGSPPGSRRGAHRFPAGVVSLLATGLLRPSEKVEAGRLLKRLQSLDTERIQATSLNHWLLREISHGLGYQVQLPAGGGHRPRI